MPEVQLAMKRKILECKKDSADNVWVSTTSSGPAPKRKKLQNDGNCGHTKDAGGSKVVEEDCRPTTSCAAGKRKLRLVTLDKAANPSNNLTYDENLCVSERRGEAIECRTAKDEERMHPASVSVCTVRTCMETVIGELKEARTRMLQWMRAEMLSMVNEIPASLRSCPRSPGEISRENMDLEEQVIQLDSALASSPSVNLLGESLRDNSNRGIDMGASSQSDANIIRGGLESGVESDDGSGGLESCDQNSIQGDPTFRMHDSGNDGEVSIISKQNIINDQGKLVALTSQDVALRDAGVSACNRKLGDIEEETGEFCVSSVDNRVDALGGFEGHNQRGRIGFSLQNDVCRNHGEQNFQAQSDICVDLGFAIDSGDSGALGYVSRDSGSQLFFGSPCGGQGSLGLVDSGHQVIPFRVSHEGKASGFVSLQSQDGPVELQDAETVNVVWNMMQQGGRNLNQRVCDAEGPSLKYDGIAKSRVEGCIPGTTTGNGIAYDNCGMFNLATVQNATPMAMRSASNCLSTLDLPTLITLQNQVAMQSPSVIQNFLDLNVGLGVLGRQMFPSVYFQESEVSTSSNLGIVPKRSSGLLSLDML